MPSAFPIPTHPTGPAPSTHLGENGVQTWRSPGLSFRGCPCGCTTTKSGLQQASGREAASRTNLNWRTTMFRILSLDGGGIRGAFAAAFLARMEDELARPIADYFDLITGTSTGGIIALALGLGEPADRIKRLYQEGGPEIFRSEEH